MLNNLRENTEFNVNRSEVVIKDFWVAYGAPELEGKENSDENIEKASEAVYKKVPFFIRLFVTKGAFAKYILDRKDFYLS